MALTGAVYKWRLDNTSYAYITNENETGGTPFIATNENNIDEGKIKEKVVSWDEQTYCEQFEQMVSIVHAYDEGKYANLQFLDCSIYLNEFSDCPDEVLKPLIPTDIALTVEATPNTVSAEFIDQGTTFSDGEYLKQFKLKLNIPTGAGGVEYTAGQNIGIENNTISALGYRYDQDKDSIAVGSGSIGLGKWSHAEGFGTQANGAASHAEGEYTQANGFHSHAEGYETIASGEASHAEGAKYNNNRNTESAGRASHAEGASTYAKADGSHAEGILNIAGRSSKEISAAAQELGISGTPQELVAKLLGYGAHVEGMNNNALGSCSHSEGYNTQAKANSTHAEGDTTIAFGEASHAEGYNTQANGNQSHAEGSGTIAIGNSAHAEGVSTVASGSFSHAEGSHTKSIGRDSHSEGAYNKAIGIASHAEGENTIAYGDSSHAEGLGTITNNNGEHAEGKYNHSNSDTEGSNNIGLNTMHSIGIGNDETDRKNAFEVMENGDVYVYNVGTYDGTNATDGAKTLQEVLDELNNGGGSSSSGVTYVGGNNIDITGGTITAKGYTYNNNNNNETLELSDNILSLGNGNATIQYDNEAGYTNGLNVTAASSININTSNGNINIAAEDGEMIIGASSNIKITGDDDIDIKSPYGVYITASDKFSVDSSSFSSTCPITAEVNGVENVYLGCPIGTIVMWAGKTPPDGWLLCDGTGIPVYDSEPDTGKTNFISKACTIQGEEVEDNELTKLVFGVFKKSVDGSDSLYGRANYYYVEEEGWIKDGTRNGTQFEITEYTTDVKEAYKFYSTIDIFNNGDVEAKFYQCINLPDFQQKFPLGAMSGEPIGSNPDSGGTGYNTNLGDTGGEDKHKLTIIEMPSHSHTITTTDGVNGSGTNHVDDANSQGSETNFSTNSNGGGQSHNNIPPFLAINFIIKYK